MKKRTVIAALGIALALTACGGNDSIDSRETREDTESTRSSASQEERSKDAPAETEETTAEETTAEEITASAEAESGSYFEEYDQNSDGSVNLWNWQTETIVATINVVNGYTLDTANSSSATVFCDSNDMEGIYYTAYAGMPLDEWNYVYFDEKPEGSDDFAMEIADLGMEVDGSEVYYAYRYNPEDEFGETEMYYIFYEYEYEYTYEGEQMTLYDCVTIELYPEQAADWEESDFAAFAKAVFR